MNLYGRSLTIRLWEQPTDRFLSNVGLLPFAVLSQTTDQEATLNAVATQIANIADQRTKSTIHSVTVILAGYY